LGKEIELDLLDQTGSSLRIIGMVIDMSESTHAGKLKKLAKPIIDSHIMRRIG